MTSNGIVALQEIVIPRGLLVNHRFMVTDGFKCAIEESYIETF